MNEVQIKYENNQMLVTSLQVAKDFKKEHQHVLRDIRKIISNGGCPKLDRPIPRNKIHPRTKPSGISYVLNQSRWIHIINNGVHW